MNACRYELDQITGGGFQSRRPPRGHLSGFYSDGSSAAKMMRGTGGFRGSPRGGGFGNGNNGNGGGFSRNNNYGGFRGGANRGYGSYNSRGRGGGNWGGRGGFRGLY